MKTSTQSFRLLLIPIFAFFCAACQARHQGANEDTNEQVAQSQAQEVNEQMAQPQAHDSTEQLRSRRAQRALQLTPSFFPYQFEQYLGMTPEELSTLYRMWEGSRGWVASAIGHDDQGHSGQFIAWGSSDEMFRLTFTVLDGHANNVLCTVRDSSGTYFRMVENMLNRNKTAINDHEWMDSKSASRWTMTQKEGEVELLVSSESPAK